MNATLNQQAPDKPWVVRTIKDHGAGQWYRYSIELENHYYNPPIGTSWTIHDFDDERFDTSKATKR